MDSTAAETNLFNTRQNRNYKNESISLLKVSSINSPFEILKLLIAG